MSDLIDAWHGSAAKSANHPFSDGELLSSPVKHSLCDKSKASTDSVQRRLSSSQKVDSGTLSSILANGRLGNLISDRLISHYGSLAMVISASAIELCRFGGLTKSQVITIKAVHTAALSLITSELDRSNIISDSKSLSNYLTALYSRDNIETFRVLFLNSCNSLIADELMASGTINHVSPYPREIIRRAIELNATALILVHNHPSGDPTPSFEDIDSTIRIRDITSALQIRIHDHIIISHGKMTSIRSLGLLD